MGYAIIENGVVVNAVVADAEFAAEQGYVLLTGGAGIGWTFANGVFSPPPPAPVPVPEFVTRAQAKIALDDAGLYDQAEAAIALASRKAGIWWREADTFRRDNEWVAAIGAQLGLSDADIDQLFIDAAQVTA